MDLRNSKCHTVPDISMNVKHDEIELLLFELDE